MGGTIEPVAASWYNLENDLGIKSVQYINRMGKQKFLIYLLISELEDFHDCLQLCRQMWREILWASWYKLENDLGNESMQYINKMGKQKFLIYLLISELEDFHHCLQLCTQMWREILWASWYKLDNDLGNESMQYINWMGEQKFLIYLLISELEDFQDCLQLCRQMWREILWASWYKLENDLGIESVQYINKMGKQKFLIYLLISKLEDFHDCLQLCGQMWQAILWASWYKLENDLGIESMQYFSRMGEQKFLIYLPILELEDFYHCLQFPAMEKQPRTSKWKKWFTIKP